MTPGIAIVGMACRYPDARSPAELWENVLAQRRAFRRLPGERLRLEDYLVPGSEASDSINATQAAVIEGYEFDRARFRVPATTFQAVDMTHWLALEVSSDALADAGFAQGEGLPEDATGVLIGNSLTGEFSRAATLRLRWPYVRRVVEAALEQRAWSPEDRASFLAQLEDRYKSPFPPVGDETLAGGLSNTIAGRICNWYDLRGGGYTVDGACASSLLAVATACSALVAGDLDVAVAGGVDLSLDPFELVGFSRLGALAAEEMRVYDARSAGFWPGEGCGIVVLMRCEDAVRQGRRVYAVIRGWGISSDGSGGITRPEVAGQTLALRRAYQRAGFGLETVPLFEGHGTGTSVGDATELRVLSQARRQRPPIGPPAAVGSIKANIGHTKAAAGVAGLIKATMAVRHHVLPPSTGWETPHPVLAEEGQVLRLLPEGEAWPADQPVRAGVSAMGFGGINVHAVLEAEAPDRRAAIGPRERSLFCTPQDAELFVFRARDEASFRRQLVRVLAYAARLSRAELTDLAAALASALEPGELRGAIVASRPAELAAGLNVLNSWLADGVATRVDLQRGVMLGRGVRSPTVGFLFPGQGSPVRLDGGVWPRRFAWFHELLQEARLPAHSDTVATEVAQPAIVTMSMAGIQILQRLGIQASVAVGHSLGELSAYHWAGAIDSLALQRIAAARGRAIADFGSPGGAMASLAAGADAVERLFEGPGVVLAGLNSPTQTVVSGAAAAVDALMARAQAAGISAVRLPVSHAFHSPLVAAAVPALQQALDHEEFRPLQRRVCSTITGKELENRRAGGVSPLMTPPTDSEPFPGVHAPGSPVCEGDLRALLIRQMTSPVRLMEAVSAAGGRVDLWIEAGPGTVLCGIVSRLVSSPVVSLEVGSASLRGLTLAAGAGFVVGAPVDCSVLFADRFARPLALDWQPRFLVNPCELAPEPQAAAPSRMLAVERPTTRVAGTAATVVSAQAGPLEIVRQLVAQRADLPVASVHEEDHLLKDFHFSSLTVGQLVAEAARTLGLTPPVSPTDAANATVGQVAEFLADLARTADGGQSAAEAVPPGVDSWVRAFRVELVERRLPVRGKVEDAGPWHVLAPPDHPLRDALQEAFARAAGGPGVVLALPPEPDVRNLEWLLQAAGEHGVGSETQPTELFLEAAQAVLAEAGGGRFVVVQHGGGGAAFARSVYDELPGVTTCVVDVPADHPQAVEWAVAEAQASVGYVEAHYDASGTRREPRLRLLSLPDEAAPIALHADDVLLVTGGGKGIAVECAFALAAETGVRLGILGRSRPSEDERLAANLHRLAAAGVRFHYCPADVTDGPAVQAAVQEVVRRLGPITAVLHAAGFNQPQRLSTLDRDGFLRTLRPKVDGARHVLAAIDPKRLRWLITFGSIIARTGMRGQADYAVANEWLTRLTERWQREHPHCRCLAAEFSVWSGVGMGERLGTIEALKQQGIGPIPPEAGTRVLRQLLAVGSETQPTVVVTGRFGEPPTLRFDAPELPLLRFLERPRVYVPGVELVVEADLSANTDPYVRDHVYQKVPLLPAVMGLEAMTQIAMTLAGSNDLPVLENVAFVQPIVIPDGGSVTIRVAALVRAPGRVEVVLRSGETGFQVDHFRALCLWGPAPGRHAPGRHAPGRRAGGVSPLMATPADSDVRPGANAPGSPAGPPLALHPERELYGSILFQTGRFRRLNGYRYLAATECIAQIGAEEPAAWFGPYLPGELVLGDPGVRDAALHAIQACIPHGTLLPVGVDRVVLGRPLKGPAEVRARERSHQGDTFVYDLEVTGEDGRLWERWEGLRLRRVSEAVHPGTWAAPLLGTYLERRLGELFPGARVSVAVESNGDDRTARSERAIRAATGSLGPIHRRPDGKPEVTGGQTVSAAHAGELTLAAAAVPTVACDVEPVAHRSDDVWQDLLHADRYRLAELMAARGSEDRDTAATRVWAAAECLTKSGRGFDTPLLFEARTEDNWVVLSAGTLRVATWVAPVRDVERELAFAVCLESDRAGL